MELKIEKNKYSPAELALLGVFAFGLLLALLLVFSRKRIPLSQPIEAPFNRLRISAPSGMGWKNNDKWIYSNLEDAYVLQSALRQSNRNVATVTWKYYPSPRPVTINEIINMKINEGNSKIRTGKMEIDGQKFTVLIFRSPTRDGYEGIEDYYYASCELLFGGHVTLEVKTLGDGELAERAFKGALKGFKYSPVRGPVDEKGVVLSVRGLRFA